MAKISYKGMELEEFTSNEPETFQQGTKAICWNGNDFEKSCKAENELIAFIPYISSQVLALPPEVGVLTFWDHCAILPQTQEAKEARMTKTKNSRTATGEYYDGEVETIVYLECLATALIRNGVEPRRAHNIVAATKYLSSRLGAKADQPIELDLMKAENYIHRARTGKWLPKERLDPFGE
jgi:hypothetical protein